LEALILPNNLNLDILDYDPGLPASLTHLHIKYQVWCKKDGVWRTLHSATCLSENAFLVHALAVGCKFKVKDTDGRLPTHIAAMEGHMDTLKWLHFVAHLSLTARSRMGCTPQQEAEKAGYMDVAEWIRREIKEENDN
jgi:ankyrin repeat protein